MYRYRSHVALTVWPIVVLFALEVARTWPAIGGAPAFGTPRCLALWGSLRPRSLVPVFRNVPFPGGLAWLRERAPGMIPWAWAVNGCASVLASILAALLALSAGFSWVLAAAALAYAGAWLVYRFRWVPT